MSRGVLRVALAMGGGVSLGTFSSSALVETLRFLRISLSNDFTGIQIDAVSGASAGSLTITLMIHGLLYADTNEDSRLKQERENPSDEYVRQLLGAVDKPDSLFSKEEKAHSERLFACYSARRRAGDYDGKLPELIDDLWRLAELEKTMDQVWNGLLNVKNLTAPKNGEDPQSFHCLFNFRGAVEDAGKMFLQRKPLCPASGMLASRILMGFTLTNLNALPGRYERFDRSFELKDAEDAAENRELRIFDLRVGKQLSPQEAVQEYFAHPRFLLVQDPLVNEKENISLTSSVNEFESISLTSTSAPSADWSNVPPYKLHDEFKAVCTPNYRPSILQIPSVAASCNWQGERLFTLRSLDTWSIILSSAVASAAFPGAFEPVSLWRYRHELPNGNSGCVRWPIANANVVEYPFSYVDGGVLNNEPVREAYRMTTLLDNKSTGSVFERIILSIDPNISSPSYEFPLPHAPVLNLPIHTLEGKYPNLQGVVSGISALLGTVSTTLSREQDKVRETIRVFELRDKFLQKVSKVLGCSGILPDTDEGLINGFALQSEPLKELKKALQVHLTLRKVNGLIPQGNFPLYQSLEHIANDLDYKLSADIFQKFFEGPYDVSTQWKKSDLNKVVKCVLYFTTDLLLELPEKNRDAKFIGIAPMWYSKEIDAAITAATRYPCTPAANSFLAGAVALSSPSSSAGPSSPTGSSKRPLELPAMKLSGFVGFISPTANAISKLAGKRLATLRLSRMNTAPSDSPDNIGFRLLCNQDEVHALDHPLYELMRAMKTNKERISDELFNELENGTAFLLDDIVRFVLPASSGCRSWWWPKNWKTGVRMFGIRRILGPKIVQTLVSAVYERYDFEFWIHLPTGDRNSYFNLKKKELRVCTAGSASSDAGKVYVPQADTESEPSKYLVVTLQWDLDENKWMCGNNPDEKGYIHVTDSCPRQTINISRKFAGDWFRKRPINIELPTPTCVDLKAVLLRPGPRIFGEITDAKQKRWQMNWSVDEFCTKTVFTMDQSLRRLAKENLKAAAEDLAKADTPPTTIRNSSGISTCARLSDTVTPPSTCPESTLIVNPRLGYCDAYVGLVDR